MKSLFEIGVESKAFVCNSPVDMYTECVSMEDAWKVFNRMPTRSMIAWSAMIFGHVKCGQGHKALALY
jgi:hypothetical protein